MGEHANPPIGWNPSNSSASLSQKAFLEQDKAFGSRRKGENDKFDPVKLFSYLVQYRWITVVSLITGVLFGVVYTWMQTPIYRSTAKIEIAKTPAKVLRDIEGTTELDELLVFETARQKILSRDLAQRVVKSLKLDEMDEFLAPPPKLSLFNILTKAESSNTIPALDNFTPAQRKSLAISFVRGGLNASLVRNSSIISIQFNHHVPNFTAMVVNQVARSYMAQNIESKSQISGLATQFIQERVVEVKEKLEKSEKALVDYAEQEGLTVVGDDSSLIAANIADLNKLLTQSVNERLLAERYVQQLSKDGAASLPQVFESKTIQTSKNKLSDLRALYQQKLATLKPGFPEMRKIRSQINEVKRNMQAEIASIGRSVKIILEQAKAKDKELRTELVRLEQKQREYERKNIRYTILKREADSARTQYQSLIGKLNEVGVGAELKNPGASIIDAGQVPSSAHSPSLTINVGAATFVFFSFGIGLIILIELLNNTFAVPDQVEKELHIPMLGLIPKLSEKEIAAAELNSASSFAEAYRTLRTSVQFTGTEDGIRHLVVTSTDADEGKSTTSIRLATDFAALGRKVLLIDGDLRKPSLHKVFGMNNKMGLSNLLSSVVVDDSARDCFKTVRKTSLTVLTAGTIPPNPADLLASPRMNILLQFLSKQFDMIIIDSPPIIGLSDAPIFSRLADATLVVIACKQTKREPARIAIGRLRAAGGNIVGAVFTKFRVDRLDYNNSYRHMRNNYYTYGDVVSQINNVDPIVATSKAA